MILSTQVNPEASKSWSQLHASLQSSAKLFYNYIEYYVIDGYTNNNTWSIRNQALGYIMFLKKKQRGKMKAKDMLRIVSIKVITTK